MTNYLRVEKGRKGGPHLREALTMLEDHGGGLMGVILNIDIIKFNAVVTS